MSQTREQANVLYAVESVYRDEILPYYMLVIRRLRELYQEEWSSRHLREVCSTIPQIEICDESWSLRGGLRFTILLKDVPNGTGNFVDETDVEYDPYPDNIWWHLRKCLRRECDRSWPNVYWPGGRYEFSKWIHGSIPCLQQYSLGQVCHITQLAIRKKQLIGYRQGAIVPYTMSDDCKKMRNATMMRPGQRYGQMIAGERCVKSWDELSRMLWTILSEHGGTVTLSDLKALFRKRFYKELSESALGHVKISELISDEQLGGRFYITQVGTQWQVFARDHAVGPALDSGSSVSASSDEELSALESCSEVHQSNYLALTHPRESTAQPQEVKSKDSTRWKMGALPQRPKTREAEPDSFYGLRLVMENIFIDPFYGVDAEPENTFTELLYDSDKSPVANDYGGSVESSALESSSELRLSSDLALAKIDVANNEGTSFSGPWRRPGALPPSSSSQHQGWSDAAAAVAARSTSAGHLCSGRQYWQL